MKEPTSNTEKARTWTPARTALAVFGVVLVLGLLRFGIWALNHEPAIPILKRADLDAAQRKWNAANLRSYDLDLAFSGGSHNKEIHLEVRNGEVTKCSENGITPAQKSAWDDFTIDHQFDMIAEDLAKAEQGGFSVQSNVSVILHANFEPEMGYPQRYLREIKGRSPLHSQWRIVRFAPATE